MNARRCETGPSGVASLRPVTALALLAMALGSCSMVLDFGSFRFAGDAAALDGESVIDSGAVDEDVPTSDLAPTDLAPQTDSPQPVDVVPPQDLPPIDVGVDAGPLDVPVDRGPWDVGVDAGPLDVPVDRGSPDTGPPDTGPPPPPRTCVEVLSRGGSASGFYSIDHDADATTATIPVYCDQVREGGGWLRMIDLSNGTACPPPLTPLLSERVCVRSAGPSEAVQFFYIPPLIAFREVRGRAVLRGRADLDAFGNAPTFLSWESAFVDGLTVSRVQVVGDVTTRQHAFTWALSASTVPMQPGQACPCAGGTAPIAEVGTRFLCRALVDAARDGGAVDPMAFRDPETPWNQGGAGCAAGNADGSFRTDLGSALRSPLEVRLTVSGPIGPTSEEVGVAALELYVR